MQRLVVELTNRCGLRCAHCYPERRGGGTDLDPVLFGRVAREARIAGFREVAFTGGEPTSHPRFAEFLAIARAEEYRWGMVSNGLTLRAILPLVLEYRSNLNAVTFSIDGSTAATHEQIRGPGSFVRVLQAVSLCAVTGVPFTINTVITALNRHQIGDLIELAVKLGAGGIRFGHLLASAGVEAPGETLSWAARLEADETIRRLASQSPIPVALAPGSYTRDLFPCSPLRDTEVNIDCEGNLTSCCHLSGHGCGPGAEAVANLGRYSFDQAYSLLLAERSRFRAEKAALHRAGLVAESDFLPCEYCARSYGKHAGRLVAIEEVSI